MSALDKFWEAIDAQLDQLTRARTADEVMTICPPVPGLSSADGFFGGSGGDGSVLSSLEEAGWSVAWYIAHYHWCARAEDGSYVTYVEGDLYHGNRR